MLVEMAAAAQPRFLPDDPIAREPDPADAAGVQPFSVHLTWDILSSLFVRRHGGCPPQSNDKKYKPLRASTFPARAFRRKKGDPEAWPAQDVNTIGEVPDSSWFTNRAGSQPLTAADVAHGPDATEGPVGRWTVVSGKTEGVRPGFTIVDSAGIRWFLKLDAPGNPEQATGAEVVSTKLFWALGYNVAEVHVATLRPDELVVSDEATIRANGRPRRMTVRDVRRVLDLSERSPDGSYRVLASKELDGKPVGEFLYYGTRDDDPNDIVPHENRRELRGMAVFAAWIDRVDAKAGNTLDTLVTEGGRTIVRHHPLDFGSTLGSAGIGPNDYWEGYEYLYSSASTLRKLPGFGFPIEPWRTIRYPKLRGVGRFEGDRFDPEAWKSRVPNPAYVRADELDTFWAARKMMAITDEMIAAAVKGGKYSEPVAESYLTQTLIKRRNAIERTYLTKVNPIMDPALDDAGELVFQNAAVRAGIVSGSAITYRASWFQFDNSTGESAPISDPTPSSVPRIQAPDALPATAGSFVRVDLCTLDAAYPSWSIPVSVYFRRTVAGWKLVGLDRAEMADQEASTRRVAPDAGRIR